MNRSPYFFTQWVTADIKVDKNLIGRNFMELSRSDFQILNVLKEHQCTNYQESMTLQEIIPELPFSRVTAYKRLKNLCDMGYTAKGCQAEQADTYYILEKGIRVADIKDMTELES